MKPLTIAEYYTALKDKGMNELEELILESYQAAYKAALIAMQGHFGDDASYEVMTSISNLPVREIRGKRELAAFNQSIADLSMLLFTACMDQSVSSQQVETVNALITAAHRYAAYISWYNVE